MMNTTQWHCEKCNASGTIQHPSDADVYGVVERLREAHRAKSPACETDLGRIRVSPADRVRAHPEARP